MVLFLSFYQLVFAAFIEGWALLLSFRPIGLKLLGVAAVACDCVVVQIGLVTHWLLDVRRNLPHHLLDAWDGATGHVVHRAVLIARWTEANLL